MVFCLYRPFSLYEPFLVLQRDCFLLHSKSYNILIKSTILDVWREILLPKIYQFIIIFVEKYIKK